MPTPRSRRPAGALPTLPLLLLTFFAVPPVLSAQSHAELVWSQLNTMYGAAANEGYGSEFYIVGHVDEGQDQYWSFWVDAGHTYRIRGACDADCHDLDLVLEDWEGYELVSDLAVDDVPSLTYTPKEDEEVALRVKMVTCSAQPCYYGIAVFSR